MGTRRGRAAWCERRSVRDASGPPALAGVWDYDRTPAQGRTTVTIAGHTTVGGKAGLWFAMAKDPAETFKAIPALC